MNSTFFIILPCPYKKVMVSTYTIICIIHILLGFINIVNIISTHFAISFLCSVRKVFSEQQITREGNLMKHKSNVQW